MRRRGRNRADQRRDILQLRVIGARIRFALEELFGIDPARVQDRAAGLEIESNHLRPLIKVGDGLFADVELAVCFKKFDMRREIERRLAKDPLAGRASVAGSMSRFSCLSRVTVFAD